MKIRNLRKTLIFLAAFVVTLLGGLTAQAATPKIAKTKTVYVAYDATMKTYDFNAYIKVNGMKAGDKIISVKTSGLRNYDGVKAKVVSETKKTVKYMYYKNRAVSVSGKIKSKKPGSSFKVLLQIRRGKKVYSSACLVKLRRVPFIISEVRIGGRKCVGRIRGEEHGLEVFKTRTTTAGNKKVSIKGMPGVKIDSILISIIEDDKHMDGIPTTELIKNNGSFSFKQGYLYELMISYRSNNISLADKSRNGGSISIEVRVK